LTYDNSEKLLNDFLWLCDDCNLNILKNNKLNSYDKNKFIEKINSGEVDDVKLFLDKYFKKLHLKDIRWDDKSNELEFPQIVLIPEKGIRLIVSKETDNSYKSIGKTGIEYHIKFPEGSSFKTLRQKKDPKKTSTAKEMFKSIALNQRKYLFYAIISTICVNILALASSFYSMQVYDRVVPTNGISTLVSLSIGVFIAILLELILKLSRASIVDQASKNMDVEYSHNVFDRFMNIRMDNMPKSVGTLSGQLQSYNSVRQFITTSALFLFVDFPFSFMFFFVILILGGIKIAAVMIIFMAISLSLGIIFKRKIELLTKESSMASHKKLGLLVESVESSHKIKANGAKWSLLNKWTTLSEDAMDDEIRIKRYTDISSYMAAFSQQISYISIVATGAYLISTTTDLTMGSLIAITILSSKVFAPIAQIPNIFVSWGRAKISIEDLDRIYSLKNDNEGINRPLNYDFNSYDIKCENLKFEYAEEMSVVDIQRLEIKKGEKVAILGVIGSGKSTLLKILSGIYKPTQGTVFIDNIDMQHVSRDSLSNTIGYLPQENKLFSGTLRYNLTFGLLNVSDEKIIEISKLTGLINLIASLPEGLDTTVPEGGESVSGGQKQLIALTRMMIANNNVLLLDEPTASMDEGTERFVINVLNQHVANEQTLVVVTHKPSILALVDRVIVLTPKGIAMDDRKEVVLNKLQQNSKQKHNGANNERS
jgi:ATP-binding cassette subfamily C protein LapB